MDRDTFKREMRNKSCEHKESALDVQKTKYTEKLIHKRTAYLSDTEQTETQKQSTW